MSDGPSTAERSDTAVLFLAHKWSVAISQRFLRLRREVGSFADCFVRLQSDHGEVLRQWTGFMQSIGAPDALVPFYAAELPAQLGLCYYGDRRIMGNTHFPLLHFARTSRYCHYWQVESDVEYRGNWRSFLSSYSQTRAPLLVSHIHNFHEWPTWRLWRTLTVPPGAAVRVDKLYKAFFPVFRISREAIGAVEDAHASGWLGHYEVLVPTALVRAGLDIADLCAINPCYVGTSQNPCANRPLQSTLRWRPAITVDEFTQRASGPLIFHPVKDNWTFDGDTVVHWNEKG